MSAESFDPPSLEVLGALLPAYEFLGFIAQGGMGAVYRARQRSLDRDVAIKILPREFGEDLEFRRSFEHEAKAMARLNHPNLIGVYDFGDAGGMPYIVMELVNGKSLFNSANNRAIDPVQAVTIVKGICDGLAHAHENGIIHRDIKPANVLLTPKAEPKIGDFGLARPAGADHSGIVMGTPGYAAPEITRQPDHADRRSDIFALGIVLYELLVGRCPPYDVPRPPASAVVGCDPALDRICDKAAHPVAAARYPSAEAMSAALEAWLRAAAAPVQDPASPLSRPAPGGPGQRPAPREMAPVIISSGGKEFSGFAKSLVMLAVAILISAFAWKKLRSLQAEKAAQVRAYEEAQAKLAQEKPKTSKREVRSPFVPGGKVPAEESGEEPAAKNSAETPLESLARLKLSLAAGDRDELPDGSIPLDDSDVMVIPTPMNWHDAAAFAESHGGHLFIVETFRDLEQLAGMIPEAESALWIGAGRTPAGTWSNVDGSAWRVTGEPEGDGAFAIIRRQEGFQAAGPNALHPFILQWERNGTNPGTLAGTLRRTSESFDTDEPIFPLGTVTYEGKPVCIVPRVTDYMAALALARQAGGHLVVADTEEKNAWLATQLAFYNGESGYWIDATRDGEDWRWTTAAAWDFTNWEAEPTAENGGGVAVVLRDGAWRHLTPGEKAAGFIIEWDSVKPGSGAAAEEEVALPPEIVELANKAKGLVDALDKERTKELAANAKTFQWDLDGWLKDLSKNENASWRRDVGLLKSLMKGDRVPAKVGQDSGIRLSPRMAKIAEFCANKQESIDTTFETKATKIRDAYVARLVEASKSADGALKKAIDRHIEAASDLDAWIHGLGLAGKPTAAIPKGGDSILGLWKWHNNASVVFHADGSVFATNGEYGDWKPTSETPPSYRINWKVSGSKDVVKLSEDAGRLEGRANESSDFTSTRIDNGSLRKAPSKAAGEDPAVGSWIWTDGGQVIILPNGTCEAMADGNTATWRLLSKSASKRTYEVTWAGSAGMIDTVELDQTGRFLTGRHNRDGVTNVIRLPD